MQKIKLLILAVFFGAAVGVFAGAGPEYQPEAKSEDENSHDLFSLENNYTFSSDFRESKLGDGDSFHTDFSYDHRFLITGKWYFRTGVEYERFDFDGTNNGLPDHLQSVYGHVAVEYVVKDHAGAGIELDPGVYFQDKVSGDAFDFPWKIFVSFPIKKDKIFGVIGFGGGLYQNPPVAPGGGLIWLFSDKLRLEGVFPKPALVYNPTDDWQFRIIGEILYESFRTDDVVTTEKKLQLHNAVVEYSEPRAGVQARYDGFKPFRIIAGAGYTISRTFDFFRADRRARTEGAPDGKFVVEARF